MSICCPYSGEPCEKPVDCLTKDALLSCKWVKEQREERAPLKVVEFPGSNLQDIPAGLRTLADSIEAGNFGEVHALVWVLDSEGKVEVGFFGQSAGRGSEAHLLLGAAQAKLVHDCL